MRRFVAALTCLLPLVAAYPQEVKLSWSQPQCQPGDAIELRAEGLFNKLASYELHLPRTEALHLVAHQRQPVHYADGVYTQRDVWVLQPLRAGTIKLDDIKMTVRQGEEVRQETRAVPALEVLPYGASLDEAAPEPLPEPKMMPKERSWAWLWLAGAGALVLLVLAFRPKTKMAEPSQSTRPGLADLQLALERGPLPAGLIEQLLADESLTLSRDLRGAMERAAYGHREADEKLLRSLLQEEAAP